MTGGMVWRERRGDIAMMDDKTKSVLRAMVIEFKKYMDPDNASHLALVENAETRLAESERGVLGSYVLKGIDVSPQTGIELRFALATGPGTLLNDVLDLLRAKRLITLSYQEGAQL